MSLTNAYATLTQLKDRLRRTDSDDDSAMESAIESASRAIDDHTGRRFFVDTSLTTRHYATSGERRLAIKDVSTLTGLVVALDWDDDGVYEQTLTASDFYLAPQDALLDGRPFDELVMTTTRLPRGNSRNALAVTATHGWPAATVANGVAACPTPVKDACLLVAARLYRRKDTPEGVAGNVDTGLVRISKYEDPDAVKLLRGFRYGGEVLVA